MSGSSAFDRRHSGAAAAPPSFDEVYRQELKGVWRVLASLGVAPAEIEDLVHDVFLTAYRKWSEYDPSRPARAWLLGIAYRKAADHRLLKRHQYEVADEQAAHRVAAPGAPSDVRDAKKLVELALSQMHEAARPIFVLHEIEQRPIPEVAALLGIPVATAYTRLRSARQTFRAVVDQHSQVLR